MLPYYIYHCGNNSFYKGKQDADQSSYVYIQVGTVDPVGDFRTMISQRDEDRFDEGTLSLHSH